MSAWLKAPVERDGAWRTHWSPRSRGVAGDGDDRTLLGDDRQLLDISDGADVVALDAVVFARGKHIDAVAQEIALQLGYGGVDVQRLLSGCADDVRAGRAPSIVVDAVDECAAVHELVSQVIVPLADAGASLVIGALRRGVAPLRPRRLEWLDLDAEPRGDADVEQCVRRRLSAGTYDAATAAIVAAKVARRAQRNFVYAELVARKLAAGVPIDMRVAGWQDQIPTDVSEVFWSYLDRFGEQREHVLDRLHPLARARGDGLTVDPPDTWLQAARALRPDGRRPFDAGELRAVAEDADDYLRSSRSCPIGRHRPTRTRRWIPTCAPTSRGTSPMPAGRAGELLERPGLLLSADEGDLRGALVHGALERAGASQPARVAVVHALAQRSASVDRRALKLRAAFRRQGEHARGRATRGARLRDAAGV